HVPASLSVCTAPDSSERSPLSLHDALPISPPCVFAKSLLSRPRTRDAAKRADPATKFEAIGSRTDRAGTLLSLRRCRAASATPQDRKSTRLNSSHVEISYAVFCLKKKTIDNRLGDDVERASIDLVEHLSDVESGQAGAHDV